MDDNESLSHTRWECKYHVVFIPKCRRKTLYAGLKSGAWPRGSSSAPRTESIGHVGSCEIDLARFLRELHSGEQACSVLHLCPPPPPEPSRPTTLAQ